MAPDTARGRRAPRAGKAARGKDIRGERDGLRSLLISLRADCQSCRGVCCVVPGFVASSQFAATKPPMTACALLATDNKCTIHPQLRSRGYPGCTVYDCFGAGQTLCRQLLPQVDWRESDQARARFGQVYTALYSLAQLRWYTAEALLHLLGQAPQEQTSKAHVRTTSELRAWHEELSGLSRGDAYGLLALDGNLIWQRTDSLVTRASKHLRASWAARLPSKAASRLNLYRADLAGQDLRDRDLRGAQLRGAILIGTDLRGLDLTAADLLGADLRDAKLSGADLRGAMFLTNVSVAAALGSPGTRLASHLRRPEHWRGVAATATEDP